jgi:2-dehydro-3-deoxygluconokinase
MKGDKIACFGEMMLRISPDTDGDWLQRATVPVYVGGSELNAASALAVWKQPVKFITALPDHAIAQQVALAVEQRGVGLYVQPVDSSRLGVYYLIQGAELKGAGVTYDRAQSAFAQLKPGMIDWEAVLADCSWFHFSAINPALNATSPQVCLEALQTARKLGLNISVDLNYRPKLWQYGKKPVEVMPELVQYAHLIMGNMWSVEALLGVPAELGSSEGKTDAELQEAALNNTAAVLKAYTAASRVVYTFRLPDRYFALSATRTSFEASKKIPVKTVVDRAGSGDCFLAGLLYGIRNGLGSRQQLDLAATAAVHKMQEKGEFTQRSIESLIEEAAVTH